jgi:ABC-type uncharacterized transport system permease subunit
MAYSFPEELQGLLIDFMFDLTLYLITAWLYGLLALRDFQLQTRPLSTIETSSIETPEERLIHRLIPLAWVTHILLLQYTMIQADGLDLSLGHAISMIGAVTTAIYWLGSRHETLGILRPVILGLTAVASMLPLLFPAQKAIAFQHNLAFEGHIIVSLTAYSLFVIAALHAWVMTIQERKLHSGEVKTGLGRLPPLVTMDALLFRMVLSGFFLLTLAVASGVLFSEELFGRPFTFNHKNLLGVLSWAIFAGLLIGRWGYGWRGRRAARWTIAGFIVLALAYVGSKLVLEVILHRV